MKNVGFGAFVAILAGIVAGVDTSVDLGNHAWQVECPKDDAVIAEVFWRRQPDPSPLSTTCIVVDTSSGTEIPNRVDLVGICGNNEFDVGYVAFQAASSGNYTLHCFPYTASGSPTGVSYSVEYLPPYKNASPSWLQENSLSNPSACNWTHLPQCSAAVYVPRTPFDAFSSASWTANTSEIAALRALGSDVVVFAGDRRAPLQTFGDRPPVGWIANESRLYPEGQRTTLKSEGQPGETVPIQVGLWTQSTKNLDIDSIQTVDLQPPCAQGSSVALHSLGSTGVDDRGRSFEQRLTFNGTGALYFLATFPKSACTGQWNGSISLQFSPNGPNVSFPVVVDLQGPPVSGGGFNESWRLSRLAWLDSTLGLDEDTVYRGFEPIKIDGQTLRMTGRTVTLGAGGNIIAIDTKDGSVLDQPLSFSLNSPLEPKSMRWLLQNQSLVEWESTLTSSDGSNATAVYSLWFDGFLDVNVSVHLANPSSFSMAAPLSSSASKYLTGFGQQGQSLARLNATVGRSPSNATLIDWKWKDYLNQGNYQLWIGTTWGGFRLKMKGNALGVGYGWESPLHQVELADMPNTSWAGQDGQGGAQVQWTGANATVLLQSGALPAGDALFRFDMVLTPSRPIDRSTWQEHFASRYYQYGYNGVLTPPDVVAFNASVYDIHQGQIPNPYINYLFDDSAMPILRNWTDWTRAVGMEAVEAYFTTRELSNRCVEQWILWAIQLAGGDAFYLEQQEVGNGNAWLREHFSTIPFMPAWQTNLPWVGEQDAAIHNVGVSRWNNFYISGLNFAVSDPSGPLLNGVYIDETAFSRLTSLRMRRAEEQTQTNVHNNLHSCNKWHCRAGDSPDTVLRATSMLIYAAHLPVFDRLWFGEGFDYASATPDYWLVELSGIPFGKTASMLDMPTNQLYRGMAAALEDNRPATCVWPVWLEIGADKGDADVYGWWNASSPITVTPSTALASVIVRPQAGVALVAVANFADTATPLNVTISINWPALFPSKSAGTATSPKVCNFQPAEPLPLSNATTLKLTLQEPQSTANGRLIILKPQ